MATFTYTHTSAVTIPEVGKAETSLLEVVGIAGSVTDVSVFLNGLTHSYVQDLDMLLVSPEGPGSVTRNLAFWSDIGGGPVDGVDFVISDAASTGLPQTGGIVSGTYRPTDYDPSETGDDFGVGSTEIPHADPGERGASFASSFGNLFHERANGTWKLYITDDAGQDGGRLDSWGLTISTDSADCFVGSPVGANVDDTIAISRYGSALQGDGSFTYNGQFVAFSGVTDVFAINGDGGNDTILGSNGRESISGGSGRDTIRAGGGNDLITIDAGEDVAGEIYDGGSGYDTLDFFTYDETVFDLRDDTIISIEQITFGLELGAYTLRIDAAQIGGSGLASNARVIAPTPIRGPIVFDTTETFAVTLSSAKSVSLADMIFEGFEAGRDFVTITGDTDNESMTGSMIGDVLNGGGGIDMLRGLAGDDLYVIDDALDIVDESVPGSGGIDTIQSSISLSLLTAARYKGAIENVTLTGTANLNATGNALNNKLLGNASNNVLDGKGGADTMIGGAGNDTYFVDNAGDVIVEQAGQGTDTVRAAISYTLTDNVERLELTSASNVSGIGNGSANTILGSTGANTLSGLGGRDTLTGGGGRDTFVFTSTSDSTVAASGRDTITDFSQADTDRIDLRLIDANTKLEGNQAFNWIGAAVFSGTAGQLRYQASGSDTLISGDVDGNGAADFAILLTGSIALTGGNFLM